jgi:1,4-dihydroxy-2-naphthoate octaprenyltransferase
MPLIRKIFILARPVQLLFGLLAYGLGLGLARYLGATLFPEPQFSGGVIIVLLLTASNLLMEYFRPPNEPISPGETRKEREELRSYLLISSVSFIACVAILVFLLNREGFIRVEAALILALFIVLALANAVPPFRLVNRGLGELSTSIQIASLSPSLGFLFQFGSLHRLLTIYTVPLLLLALAYFLALNFPAYADDLKYERRSLLMSLTWQRAVPIHNVLLVAAYLYFAAIPFLGVPVGLVWPALLTLPIASYQVFALRSLAEGAKPIWSIFIASATAIFGLTTYLVALTFWLR